MSERSSYEHGTPSWVDLMTPDPAAAKTFYSSLFGWTAEDMTGPDGEYIYTNLSKDGKLVCGLGSQNEEMADMPPVWTSYVNVDSAEQIEKAVGAAGGQTLAPPMQIMDEGTMALFADPTGAAFGVWQPANHIGAEIVNEANTYAWNELMTRDVDAATGFYTQVFGWQYDAMEMGPLGTYHVAQGGEDGGLAGIMPMPPELPDQVPNHWGVYFMVDDTDAVCAKAVELGGSVVNGPMDSPVGRLATLHDPQHGSFSLMQPASHHEE